MNYMKYAMRLNMLHEDVLMKIFVSSLESSKKDFLRTHVIQRVSLLLQRSLKNFSGIIGQLVKVCNMLSKRSNTLFVEKVF
jgi:hypothetical protein